MREFRDNSGKLLATYIVGVRNQNKLSPILWLGAGCSVSSGCPTSKDLNLKCSLITDINFSDLDEIPKDIFKLLSNNFIKSDKSSLGYSILVQLIARNYFQIILTTNYDFHVENNLQATVPFENIFVHSRPNDNDDNIAAQIKNLQADKVLIIHLHGNLRGEQIYKYEELLDFNESLTSAIRDEINKRGLIFIGTSLYEDRLPKVIPKNNRIWNVNPFATNNKFNKTFGIAPERQVTGDDALFDNFMQGLCSAILTEELSDRILMKNGKVIKNNSKIKITPRELIDSIVEEVRSNLKVDSLDDTEIIGSTRELLEKIRKYSSRRGDKTCIIYAYDPEAPGGREMQNLIEREGSLSYLVKDYKIFTAHIINTPYEKRRLEKLLPDNKLNGYKTIIIMDDISFTGNTLRLLRDDLVNKYGANKNSFVAALLRIDDELLSNLENDGWKVFYKDKIKGFGLMCPWGFVRPTKAILPNYQKRYILSKIGHLKSSDFIVQDSFGYVPKPWGEMAILCDNSYISSRIFSIDRGQRTSLHYHKLRDEIFLVMDNRIGVCLWDRFIKMHRHQSLRIPAGVPHSIVALEDSCRVLEISEGYLSTQYDIVRIYDLYNRELKDFGDDGLI